MGEKNSKWREGGREGGQWRKRALTAQTQRRGRERGKSERECVQRSRLFFVLFDDAHNPGWLRRETGLLA